MTADEWNRAHSVGTRVRYYPILGMADHVDSVTRSEAWTLGSGHAVVAIKGRAGGVSLEHIAVLEGESDG